MIYEPFSVVIVPFPFTDKKSQKTRPAIVLSALDFQTDSRHCKLMMITSAGKSGWACDFKLQDLNSAGLQKPCVARLKIFTLDSRLITGKIGELAKVDQESLRRSLSENIGV